MNFRKSSPGTSYAAESATFCNGTGKEWRIPKELVAIIAADADAPVVAQDIIDLPRKAYEQGYEPYIFTDYLPPRAIWPIDNDFLDWLRLPARHPPRIAQLVYGSTSPRWILEELQEFEQQTGKRFAGIVAFRDSVIPAVTVAAEALRLPHMNQNALVAATDKRGWDERRSVMPRYPRQE